LEGSASADQIKQNKAVFEKNIEHLGDEPATWVVLPHSGTPSRNDENYSSGSITKKGIPLRAMAVVVVRSTRFFIPEPKTARRRQIDKSILVCNVPVADFTIKFFKKQPGSSIDENRVRRFVDGTFELIAAFIRDYNDKAKQDAKIQLVAMPYFGVKVNSVKDDLEYDSITAFGAGGSVNKKGTARVSNAKTNGAKPKKASSEDEEGFDNLYSSIWFDARSKFFDSVKEHGVDKVLLMHGKSPWGAHDNIIGESLKIRPFPECIRASEANEEEEEEGYIPQNMIEHTLFVCDREVGSKVGNKNNGDTTGGIFGMYVPMHYVAAPFPRAFAENKWLKRIYVSGLSGL